MHLPRMKEIRSRYMSAAESPTRPTILKVVDEESPKETEKLYSPQRVEVDDCEKYQKKAEVPRHQRTVRCLDGTILRDC